jgi:hypothetical protein
LFQVIARKSIFAGKKSNAASQGKPGYAYVGRSPSRKCHTLIPKLFVHTGKWISRLYNGYPIFSINFNLIHLAYIDNNTAIYSRKTFIAVPPTAYSHPYAMLTGPFDCVDHILGPTTKNNDLWKFGKAPIELHSGRII